VPVKLARITGLPLPKRQGGYAPSVFRPRDENRDPPRLGIFEQELSWPGELPVALAVSPEGRLAVMSWVLTPAAETEVPVEFARIRLLYGEQFGNPIMLSGARFPYSFAWLSADRIAVLVTGLAEAVTYPVEFGDSLAMPVGDFYPLSSHDGGPFLHGTGLPPHYGMAHAGAPPHPLLPISLPSLARTGVAQSMADPKKGTSNPPLVDSGSARTEWHRLYLEAIIPPHCGIRVWLAATSVPEPPPESDDRAWHEHRFGAAAAGASRDIPSGVWVPSASEIPFHQGMLCCDRNRDHAGLFTVLIQRAGRRVRTLRGRYLWVRVELSGDGRTTPDLVALRAYASRFSYVEHYLPELYREAVFGDDADKTAPSTAADFLERFLDNCEGVLTPIEDKIASAFLLTDPRTVPEDALEWLASWIGFAFDPVVPPERRRRLLQEAPVLYRWRGTLRGLSLALDAATGGAVGRGGIVIVEDFKLRRTFSTILGADLETEGDPLLPGLFASGNSFVGDTLILGHDLHKEFLALFGRDILKPTQEQKVVEEFLGSLAHRVTVLVHQDVTPQDLGLIRRIAELDSPAHVSVSVSAASYPFLVGIASLVGVDTFLARPEPPRPVRIGESWIGVRDLLTRPPSLDPRMEGGGDG
jgi:phage tail-like protein